MNLSFSDLPPAINRTIANFSSETITVGHSNADVIKFSNSGEVLFLKRSPVSRDPDPGHSAASEAKILEWLSSRLPVPKVVEVSSDNSYEYLLMREVSGTMCSTVSNRKEVQKNLEILIEAIKLLHSIPVKDCPFIQTLDVKLPAAKERVRQDLVDPEDFDDEHLGKTSSQLLEELLKTEAPSEDLVFCHGDLCLPNILVVNERCSGFIDLGRAGIADKYQDIALLRRSIICDLNPLYRPEDFNYIFSKIYGGEIDLKKANYYCLLDEFF